MLTQARLKEVLHYDPDTGIWTWLVSSNQLRPGDRAGTLNGHGYRQIGCGGKVYRSGRLAHFYMKGEWPELFMDHKNGDGTDDRWDNLREATRAQNNYNTRGYGHLGVKHVYMSGRKFVAKISVNKKSRYLGTFATQDEAAEAIKAAIVLIAGEFAVENRDCQKIAKTHLKPSHVNSNLFIPNVKIA